MADIDLRRLKRKVEARWQVLIKCDFAATGPFESQEDRVIYTPAVTGKDGQT